MYTYQDLEKAKKGERELEGFLIRAVSDYKQSKTYRDTLDALAYWRNENPTITKYRKLLYTVSGRAVPDNYSANFRLASNVYFRFVTQTVQYLLGYGVRFEGEGTKKLLGGDSFDHALQEALTDALNGGVAYGFMNNDRVEVFGAEEFAPLYDEETGELKAGIRFWQLDIDKPLRLTLFELDGYTEYIKRRGEELSVMKPKKAYKQIVIRSDYQDDTLIEENYEKLPIVPLYSPRKQSGIVGLRRQIDCYDLIESGFANDIDDASMIYWTISNAGGMDDIDLARFIEHMKTVKAAVIEDDGAQAESHTTEIPYASREAMLTRLENEMYRDFMVLNLDTVSGGNSTATAIKAAYEPMNLYSNMLEYAVLKFVHGLLNLIGVEDNCTFKRDTIVNEYEKAQTERERVETALLLRGLFDDETIKTLCAEALGI